MKHELGLPDDYGVSDSDDDGEGTPDSFGRSV
jgi:hypothetical protein